MMEYGSNYGHNVVVKCAAAAWCETNVVTGLMQKGNFTNTDSWSCFFIELNSCTSEMSCFSCSG